MLREKSVFDDFCTPRLKKKLSTENETEKHLKSLSFRVISGKQKNKKKRFFLVVNERKKVPLPK